MRTYPDGRWRTRACLLGVLVASSLSVAMGQENKPAGSPDEASSAAPRPSTEPLSAWEWYQEVRLPPWQKPPRWVDFVLPPGVFGKARADLGDLRLYDAQDRVVPYALRVRSARSEQVPIAAREFNRAVGTERSAELSLDLGEHPAEHNQIEVSTSGNNFRRRIQVEASDDGQAWSTLKLDKEHLVHFKVDSQLVEVRRVGYPASRHRYLRVKVFPDAGLTDDKPEISTTKASRTLQVAGEDVTLPANLGPREPARNDGSPASAWMIDFGGEKAPCTQLTFNIADAEFTRSFRLVVPGTEHQTIRYLGAGTWKRGAGDQRVPMEISFTEVTVRRLRLIVTDYNNPPLNITAVRYLAPARQVVFAPTPELALPLRLSFGQPTAEAPHYDFEAILPPALEPLPVRATLEPIQRNPSYEPPPKPFTERWPWLVYVVLGAASLVLAVILAGLGREAIANHDATAGTPDSISQEGAGR